MHRRHIPKLKMLFESNGGIVLHADGTGEAGDEVVFSTKEELWFNLVIQRKNLFISYHIPLDGRKDGKISPN